MAPTPEPNSAPPTSPEVLQKYTTILKSNGITNPISEVIVKGSGLKGENFGGLTEYVTVKFEDPGKKPLELFVKRKVDNPQFNKILEDWQAYQKESLFFMEYLPMAGEYCRKMGHDELMNIYPKCYFGDDTEIILENLVLGRNFILLKKEELQDFETAKIALINLAKHHAISHAVIQDVGGAEKFFQRFPLFQFETFMTEGTRAMIYPTFVSSVDTNINILKKCEIEGRDHAIQVLNSLQGKHFDQLLGSLENSPSDLLTLNHGDYWNNNMMFLKDPGTNRIVDHVAIDFQGIRYTSACVDLGYYFFTSVKTPVRQGRLRELLAVYLDALKATGKKLGHPINKSQQELESEFCKHFHYGYWFGMGMVTGAGYEVMKDIDIGEIEDMSKMLEMWDELIVKWVDTHPEECKVKAWDIIEYVKAYEQLSNELVPQGNY